MLRRYLAQIVVRHYRMLDFQVAQIYKDPSVGNPVSVAVVKVEILKVRNADCKVSSQDV
jgi:hypothetical protein